MTIKKIKAHVVNKNCRFCEKKPATKGGFLCDKCREELYNFLFSEEEEEEQAKEPQLETMVIECYTEWR